MVIFHSYVNVYQRVVQPYLLLGHSNGFGDPEIPLGSKLAIEQCFPSCHHTFPGLGASKCLVMSWEFNGNVMGM